MKIGTSTRAVWNVDTLEAIDLLSNIGYQQIEFWVEYPNLCLDLVSKEEIESILEKVKKCNIDVSIHAPIRDINISSLNYGVRKESIRQIKDAIKFANSMNSSVLVIHPGKNSSQKDPFSMTESLFYDSLEQIIKIAEQEKVVIAMENMEQRKGEYIIAAESLKKVIDKFKSPYFKATFDIAHANTYTDNLIEYYNIIADEVVHIHISDNLGLQSKTHLKICDGAINFNTLLYEIHKSNYSDFITIEGYDPHNYKDTVKENYRNLKNILEEVGNIK